MRLSTVGSLLILVLASACSSAPYPDTGASAATSPAAKPQTQVYFYPTAGQSEAQQDRDRYECYRWAVTQTGFDPSEPQLAPHQRVRFVPARGDAVVAGAATGAVVGAIAAGPRDSGEGAVVGAIAGAMIGAAAQEDRARQAQDAYNRDQAARQAALEQRADNYRRAMSACLEGRGYTVR